MATGPVEPNQGEKIMKIEKIFRFFLFPFILSFCAFYSQSLKAQRKPNGFEIIVRFDVVFPQISSAKYHE